MVPGILAPHLAPHFASDLVRQSGWASEVSGIRAAVIPVGTPSALATATSHWRPIYRGKDRPLIVQSASLLPYPCLIILRSASVSPYRS